MRRLKLLGAACVVLVALVAVATNSASAFTLPEVLGITAGAEFKTKDSVANPTFETLSGNTVTCEHVTGSGTVEAGLTLGPFHVTFAGHCKGTILGIASACTGLGDATETILTLGKWHTVVDTKSGEALGAAILLLLEPVHFTCGIALIEVKGSLLCLITTPLTSALSHTTTCTQTKGMAGETKYLNDAGVETAIEALLSSTNHGAFEEAGEAATGTIEFAKAVTIDD
jgi:hypothetical protein